MRTILLSISLLIYWPCFSQTAGIFDVGNGSIAWVCRADDGEIKSIKMIEVLEAEYISKDWRVAENFSSSEDHVLVLNKYLDKLSKVDVERASKYKAWLKTFFENSGDVHNQEMMLTDTADSFSPIKLVDKNCKKENVMSQLITPLLGKKYLINRELFDHPLFGNVQRAMAILHELIYREVISEGRAGNSLPVRFLTSFLVSESFEAQMDSDNTNVARKAYLIEAQRAGLKTGAWGSTVIHLNTITNGKSDPVVPLSFCDNSQIYQARGYNSLSGTLGPLKQWDCESGQVENAKISNDEFSEIDFLNQIVFERYKVLLGREPSSQEYKTYQDKYNSGFVIDEIKESIEALGEVKIREHFIIHLGRYPSEEDLAHYLDEYNNRGISLARIEAEISASPEAQALRVFINVFNKVPSWKVLQKYISLVEGGLTESQLKEKMKDEVN